MSAGRVVSSHIARQAEGPMESLVEVRAIPGHGLEGDRYSRGEGSFSKNPGGGREVTLIAQEMIEFLAREAGIRLEPGEARRNLVTQGVALNELVGKIFRVGSVQLKGVRLAEPCDHLQRLTHQGVLKGLVHRGGLRAELVDGGVLRVGDAIDGPLG
jgi:MOSC domain-containing protein YiiM